MARNAPYGCASHHTRRRSGAIAAGVRRGWLHPYHRADTHLTRTAFEDDRRRDAALLLAGCRVVRFTWRRVTHEPQTIADTLRRLL